MLHRGKMYSRLAAERTINSMNATHLFEKVHRDRSLPASSESFWTTIFALLLLHLADSDGEKIVPAWQPVAGRTPPYYERKAKSAALCVHGLNLDAIAVEPRSLMDVWPTAKIGVSQGGISPDLVLHLAGTSEHAYALVENKITSNATLNANQFSAYPSLITELTNQGNDAHLYVLHSIGCSRSLYDATISLQARLNDRFGILLWEDVFRIMYISRFSLPGIDRAIFAGYSGDAGKDCRNW